MNRTTNHDGPNGSDPAPLMPNEEVELDQYVQNKCVERILAAEESGNLLGAEAPTFHTHELFAITNGSTIAKTLTRQLNHLADQLGVLGFQVDYGEEKKYLKGKGPRAGYFRIRVLAQHPEEKPKS